MATRCSPETQVFLPDLWPGSFRLQTFFPTAELSADLLESSDHVRVFIVRDEPAFPCELTEKLNDIEARDRFVQHGDLMLG